MASCTSAVLICRSLTLKTPLFSGRRISSQALHQVERRNGIPNAPDTRCLNPEIRLKGRLLLSPGRGGGAFADRLFFSGVAAHYQMRDLALGTLDELE